MRRDQFQSTLNNRAGETDEVREQRIDEINKLNTETQTVKQKFDVLSAKKDGCKSYAALSEACSKMHFNIRAANHVPPRP